MIQIEYHWIFFIIIAGLLVYKSIKKYDNNAGNFTPDTSSLKNIFYIGLLLVFILVWGGMFWW